MFLSIIALASLPTEIKSSFAATQQAEWIYLVGAEIARTLAPIAPFWKALASLPPATMFFS
jgi:hypothetical protein